jgi:NitT/TauT family transport system permease protein
VAVARQQRRPAASGTPLAAQVVRAAARHAARTAGLGLVLLWELAAAILVAGGVPLATSKLPAPHAIVTRMVQEAPLLLDALWVTSRGALIGLLVGLVLGVTVSLVLAQSRVLEAAFYPYVIGGQMLPTIALAPLLLAVLQNATLTRIIVAAYITFFAITIGTLKGLKSVAPESMELMRSYNVSRRHLYTKLKLPASLPFLFAGLKVAAPLAVVGEIVVELTGSNSGLGYLILSTQYYGPRYATLFWASMLITLALGFVFYRAVAVIERMVSPWQHEFRTR